MTRFRIWRRFDYVLLAVTILLAAYGVVMIYSANLGLGSLNPDLADLWRRQAILGAAGIGLVFLLAAFPRDYQWLGDFWWLAYLLAVVLLVLVLFFGRSEIGEVRGWLDLGFFRFQPSFLAMNLLTISVGAILSRRRRKRSSPAPPLFGAPKTSVVEETAERPDLVNYLASVVMALVLAALVFLEPDMATAAVFIFMWLVMLLESDVEMRYLVLTAVVGLGSLYPLWKLVDLLGFGYMHERVLGFFNPGSNPYVEYQLEQAFMAIASGGLWGQGLFQGASSRLRFLPVRHTDFIFAVLAEELGFAGVMLLFVLYLVLFLRLLRIAVIASDGFGRLLVVGTLAMILFQLVVNIAMNLGLLPVAGLPLPFISYGPAALLTTMIGIGVAENVAMHHRKLEF
ncbi:MAG: FtsW/RodA/SpoVE family cell cycle protein [Chloroflexi bacterium]|nr:FtsW/RodA/SpoVE family cell cycle protein [Chloroflexota bacterium]